MTNDEKVEYRLLEILEEAILDERASKARYKHGAELSTDPDMAKMFEELAADEVEHEKTLLMRYHAVKKKLGLKVMKGDI